MADPDHLGELAARYRVYAGILAAVRTHSTDSGLLEFLPPRHVAGYAHIPAQHFVLQAGADQEIILPYQLTLFNRLATHFLDRPTFCFGPCYRNEPPDPTRLKAFYQFSFEIFTEDLPDLVAHVSSLLAAVWAAFGYQVTAPGLVDLRGAHAPTNDEIVAEANRLGAPILVLYKRKGIAPLLNQLHDGELEIGLELILPHVGETLDGGLRDPAVLRQLYGVEPARQTAGASLGLERLAAYLLGSFDISNAQLL